MPSSNKGCGETLSCQIKKASELFREFFAKAEAIDRRYPHDPEIFNYEVTYRSMSEKSAQAKNKEYQAIWGETKKQLDALGIDSDVEGDVRELAYAAHLRELGSCQCSTCEATRREKASNT